jgi:ribonuclease HII
LTRGENQPEVISGSKINKWGYLSNVKCKDSKHFRNKEREYLKHKISRLATNSKKTRTSETCKEE